MDDPEMRWFWILGRVFGVVVGLVTFLGCWIAATASWGFLGFLLAWYPALFIGNIAGLIAWAMWGPLWILAVVGVLWWALWGRYH